ncbi:MAG: hypothetical protein PHQ40_19195, partial [Anaerolineaceae bacterium]|nr:hypothetical protein [Anaerolineaceae bacterium]
MNQHLNEGQMRAALDGEATPEERNHLDSCAVCLQQQNHLRLETERAARKLTFLVPASQDAAVHPRMALTHFYDRISTQKENSMFRKWFASPALRVGMAVVLLLALVVAIPSTRALADRLLNLFRVQQVAIVPVDFTGMQQITGDSAIGKQITQLLSSSVTMTKKPESPAVVANPEEASRIAGFSVRLPAGLTPTHISVEKGAAFSFKVDRSKAQALLDEAGRKDLVLPTSIDGADISIDIPSGVSASYGKCPDPSIGEAGRDLGSGSAGRQYPDCVIFAQIPSPTVNAPAEVDVAQLAQIGLEFTGMTPEQAAAFAKTVDWTSSLVIPIPKNAATYAQIPVDGVTGTLIQRPADDAPQFALVWV